MRRSTRRSKSFRTLGRARAHQDATVFAGQNRGTSVVRQQAWPVYEPDGANRIEKLVPLSSKSSMAPALFRWRYRNDAWEDVRLQHRDHADDGRPRDREPEH